MKLSSGLLFRIALDANSFRRTDSQPKSNRQFRFQFLSDKTLSLDLLRGRKADMGYTGESPPKLFEVVSQEAAVTTSAAAICSSQEQRREFRGGINFD